MKITRRSVLACAASVITLASVGPSFAAGTVVKVSLWDKGPASMGMLDQGVMLGMGMMGGDMSKATMGIDAAPQTMPAGEITFEVTNASKNLEHEMIVAPVKDPNQPLPYDESAKRVDEDAAGSLGEVAELKPGKSGTLKLTLEPGKYILYCNIRGHYVLGMWTLITVT